MNDISLCVVAAEAAGGQYSGTMAFTGDRLSYSGSLFTRGTRRLLNTDVLSAEALPAGAQERMVVTDPETVVIEIAGIAPRDDYELELVFLSEIEGREVGISAAATLLDARLPLPRAQITSRRWPVPSRCVQDGRLTIRVERVEGPAALVSAVTLRAMGKTARTVGPDLLMRVPRISPEPVSVSGVGSPRMDLAGTWRFHARADAGLEGAGAAIEVPGQWAQQGFTVDTKTPVAYERDVTIPADWRGKRVKLRCDAVYSDAVVLVDGTEQGRHQGGFTPFEVDITDAARPGHGCALRVIVTSGGDADRLASGMQYAAHDLGGISRGIRLIALPVVNLASLHVRTILASSAARLELRIAVANESPDAVDAASLSFLLRDPQGHAVPAVWPATAVPRMAPGETAWVTASLDLERPELWDVEHPRLYTLAATVAHGDATETVSTRVGVREVAVRGNQFFVNGRPVKLRGVCRHEAHPTRGRSLPPGWGRADAELFARANVNFVRTSHYPPSEEFLDACDEIGMLVESEAPLCWSPPDCPEALVVAQNLEMVEFNRNHPSVVIWSIANESRWDRRFDLAARLVGAVDASRPRIFSHGEVDIASVHYPGYDGAEKTDASAKPVLFDEYCHLNAYNRREQIADPGLRDAWGLGATRMWEDMRAHPGCLGGALWAAIDDTFFLPGERTFGYGTWGPVDGWRRPKPEHWHMAKSFSPVRILAADAVPESGAPLRLRVENRSDFADLSEMTFSWEWGSASGVARAAGAPGSTGVLEIALPAATPTGIATDTPLSIRVTGPRGFLVDAYAIRVAAPAPSMPAPLRPPGSLALERRGGDFLLSGEGFSLVVDSRTGLLRGWRVRGVKVPLSGPFLTLVPLDAEGGGIVLTGTEPVFAPLWGLCRDWQASSVGAEARDGVVVVSVSGGYAEANGSYVLSVHGSGRMTLAWDFTLTTAMNPRQIGATFVLPVACDTLSWKRVAQWSWYPEEHIGRPEGNARAFPGHPPCGLVGPRGKPSWPWSEDENAYGSNDFRSTKMNILEAGLTDSSGAGLRAVACGDRHAHAWIDGGRAHLMVGVYANEGAESYLRMTRVIPDRPIPAGGRISGSVTVDLLG